MTDDRVLLTEMTQPEAAEALGRGTAIIATGSVEQHGGHLPLGTDAIAALTVAERVAVRIDAPVIQITPVGVAHYHLPWAGSLTITVDTFVGLLRDVCAGLAKAGVRRVLLVNWHEGNSPAIRVGADAVQQELGMRVVVAETHIITNSLYPDEMEFTHAGAMETSAVLAYDPSLVRIGEQVEGDPTEIGNDGHALFRRRDVYPILRDFREVAHTGWYGSPGWATKERADQIFDEVADHVVEAFESICEKLDEFDRIDG